MKTIDQLTKDDLKGIKLLCFDCDGVTVKEGTKIVESGNRLEITSFPLESSMVAKLQQLKKQFFLVFSSGRSLLHLSRIYEPILWNGVALQAEVGLFTLYQGQVLQLGEFTSAFLEKSTRIRSRIRQLSSTNSDIVGFEPKQFLISVHCRGQQVELEEIVRQEDPEKQYYCLWSGEAYDIGPKQFNKGTGLKFLLDRMALSFDNVLAVGNDPNDQEMVESAGISVTTDPTSVIRGADFVSNQKFEAGGQEIVDRLLELIK
ncbi:MAG: HAD-IIB family hydrolase [Patescibacteria group bacterium]